MKTSYKSLLLSLQRRALVRAQPQRLPRYEEACSTEEAKRIESAESSPQGTEMSYLDLHKYKKKEVSLPPIEEHAPKMQQRPRIPQRKRIMAPISPSYFRC